MTGKTIFYAVLIGSFLSLFGTGCGPQEQLALKFAPQDSTFYKVATESGKDYMFDRPSINKSKKDQHQQQYFI